MASFTKEVNTRLAKRPLKINGRLAQEATDGQSDRTIGNSVIRHGQPPATTVCLVNKGPGYFNSVVN